jgi:creatinine amidohydrolase
VAATEQHGPHLPVGTDVMIAQAYLARVRELLPDNLPATFLPIQPVGISTEHIGYPGTLTLPTDVALKTGWPWDERCARVSEARMVCLAATARYDPCRAGPARCHAGFSPSAGWSRLQRAGGIIFGRRCIMASWRCGPDIGHAGIRIMYATTRSPDFPP